MSDIFKVFIAYAGMNKTSLDEYVVVPDFNS